MAVMGYIGVAVIAILLAAGVYHIGKKLRRIEWLERGTKKTMKTTNSSPEE